MTELCALLKCVIGTDVSEEIRCRLQAEELDVDSIKFLADGDLEQLGFKMGPRKKILAWIALQSAQENELSPEMHVQQLFVSTPSASSVERQDTDDFSTQGSSVETPRSSAKSTSFKNFDVDKILSKFTKGEINGPDLAQRLREGYYYEPKERRFFIKVLGRHLMMNCQIQYMPSKQEKMDMAQSIVDCFPVLKDPVTGGYECIYDPEKHCGHLEAYIRGRRHRDPEIETLWKKPVAKKLDLPLLPTSEANERILRERRPNIQNVYDLRTLMDGTRSERRAWIEKEKPSITTILQRYPRFLDVPDAVRDEFLEVWAPENSLRIEWLRYKEAILNSARDDSSLQTVLSEISDDLDEDKKSLVASKCLIYLLQSPPQNGLKRARMEPAARVKEFFCDFEEKSVEEALKILDSQSVTSSPASKIVCSEKWNKKDISNSTSTF